MSYDLVRGARGQVNCIPMSAPFFRAHVACATKSTLSNEPAPSSSPPRSSYEIARGTAESSSLARFFARKRTMLVNGPGSGPSRNTT